jgi:hypothetical protein
MSARYVYESKNWNILCVFLFREIGVAEGEDEGVLCEMRQAFHRQILTGLSTPNIVEEKPFPSQWQRTHTFLPVQVFSLNQL